MTIRIGTAAWALPREVRDTFPPGASNLERYAARFDCTEINSSFYRPHRPATYARWAESVPDDFRFSIKLPRAITHEAKLIGCEDLLARFADEIAGLGGKRGPILMQLPPKLVFDGAIAATFLSQLRKRLGRPIACEPRHPSWFAAEADALLAGYQIARVAADPAPVPAAARPGGWSGLAYFRLHGSPRIYWSSYDEAARANWAQKAKSHPESWVIFDNTASGAATRDAMALQALR
ncbi:MAG: DUF72 domain-containing protein [Sphingomonas sp.]|uniref:DUF72 domain-containing protein n=1 Tax=Sphingomonas sp. TaxID=28214 RepID=UPI0025EF5BC4|nr:DUF72 domain-containing protein [Sphingomonas sp.]MBX3564109.1 DUF72 domain-containing protein [Sphingomonas sp.]